MITRALVSGIFGFLSCAAFASADVDDGLSAANNVDMVVADNKRKDRRDDRHDDRDDKQDCRKEEGRVSNDKRECKQEKRGKNDEAKDDKEDGADA